MRKITIFLFLFILAVLQISIVPRLSIFNVFPNILLASILSISIIKEDKSIIFFAFVAGLLMDFLSGLPFGINALNFVFTLWAAKFIGRNIFKTTDLFGQASLIIFACFLYSALNIILLEVFHLFGLGLEIPSWLNLLRIGLAELILNSLLAIIILIIAKKTYGFLARF
ncbi:MAG: rod shape-determining protein MreD [Candidatus Portnoybacteria bacterium]|nr:rod shape-determining protein MreD [Candidatus Portnoybacteria bacterium]